MILLETVSSKCGNAIPCHYCNANVVNVTNLTKSALNYSNVMDGCSLVFYTRVLKLITSRSASDFYSRSEVRNDWQ